LAGKRKTCNTDLHPSQGQQNLFLQAIILFTAFNVVISEFRACLVQNIMAQEQPYPRLLDKRLLGSHLEKNAFTKTRPGCWVLFKMAAAMVEF